MTTKQIDYCIELAHTLNFSRGADNMFVSQPTFSYQIRLLEEEVGFTIFERSGKGASLTPAGAQFVSFLTGMREDLKRAIEQGQNFSARYKDNISVCMMVRQALYFLPEAMRIFAEARPDVQITPVFQYENSIEKFLQNEVDIVFTLREQTRQVPGIQVHDLFESRIYLITNKDDPLAEKTYITKEDLLPLPLILPERSGVQSELANWFGKDFAKLNIAFTSNLGTNAAILAMQGLGYPISIEGAGRYWRSDLLVQKKLYPEITASTVIAWRRNIPYAQAVLKFIDEVNAFQA